MALAVLPRRAVARLRREMDFMVKKRATWDQPGGLKQEIERVKKEVMFGMKIDSGDIGKVLYSCVLSGIETVDIN